MTQTPINARTARRQTHTMNRPDLRHIDLNLLVAFDALVVEGNVSRAASRVGISQPAMSRSLQQLRRLFDDTLFRRTPNGMVPTPQAVELARQIQPALEQITSALGQQIAFDPASAKRRFVIGMPDMPAALALPPIVRALTREAPHIDLQIISIGNQESVAAIEHGHAELALGVYKHLPRDIRHVNLKSMPAVCVADPDNPLLQGRTLDLPTFLSLPHITVATKEDQGTPVDSMLEMLGLDRRVVVSTPFFVSIPSMILGTSMVAVVIDELLDLMPESQALARYPIPLPVQSVMLRLIWHARSDTDAGHRWCRSLIAQALGGADAAAAAELPCARI